ncbi:hypothetical protein LTR53_002972 [Teratosphaeriaceae sp. CCFEE 6253]|nr:hypothetical protein LTR53_002972 [Teratosphaeriaceae sp. CCFEE 6253]
MSAPFEIDYSALWEAFPSDPQLSQHHQAQPRGQGMLPPTHLGRAALRDMGTFVEDPLLMQHQQARPYGQEMPLRQPGQLPQFPPIPNVPRPTWRTVTPPGLEVMGTEMLINELADANALSDAEWAEFWGMTMDWSALGLPWCYAPSQLMDIDRAVFRNVIDAALAQFAALKAALRKQREHDAHMAQQARLASQQAALERLAPAPVVKVPAHERLARLHLDKLAAQRALAANEHSRKRARVPDVDVDAAAAASAVAPPATKRAKQAPVDQFAINAMTTPGMPVDMLSAAAFTAQARPARTFNGQGIASDPIEFPATPADDNGAAATEVPVQQSKRSKGKARMPVTPVSMDQSRANSFQAPDLPDIAHSTAALIPTVTTTAPAPAPVPVVEGVASLMPTSATAAAAPASAPVDIEGATSLMPASTYAAPASVNEGAASSSRVRTTHPAQEAVMAHTLQRSERAYAAALDARQDAELAALLTAANQTMPWPE